MQKKQIFMLLILLIILSLFGCSVKKSNVIEFNNSFTIEFDERNLTILEELRESVKQNEVITPSDLDETFFYVITPKQKYRVYPDYVYFESNFYKLDEQSLVFFDIVDYISKNISNIVFKDDNTLAFLFKDLNYVENIADKDYITAFQTNILSAKNTVVERSMIPFPNLEVDNNGFKLIFLTNQTVILSLNDYYLDYYLVKSNDFLNKIKSKYSHLFDREGFFAYQKLSFSFDNITYHDMNNNIYRIDEVRRMFNFSNTLDYPQLTSNKISLLFDDHMELIIYDNDIWYYNGNYYLTEDLYHKVSWMLQAG